MAASVGTDAAADTAILTEYGVKTRAMPITNALDNAKRLESLGFTHEQARGISEILE